MKNEIKTIVSGERFALELSKCLPSGMSPDVLARIALTAINKTPKLADCTAESICACLLDLAAAGLVPDGRRVHLIPRKNQCTLLIDYKGYLEIAYRNPLIAKIHVELICSEDEFEHDRGTVTRHSWDATAPRGPIRGAYAEAVFVSGASEAVIMSVEEIESIRDNSSQGTDRGDSPWKRSFGEMCKKTAIRRLMKLIPLPAEAGGAIAADGGDIEIAPRERVIPRGKGIDRLAAPKSRPDSEDKGDPSPKSRPDSKDQEEDAPKSRPDAEEDDDELV